MANIKPITALRNTDEISEICHRTKKPVYITKDGNDDLVIMSADVFKNILEQIQEAQDEFKLRETSFVYRTSDLISASNALLGAIKPGKTDNRCAGGILSKYADSALTDIEKTAFERAMVKKYENNY